MFQSSKVVLRPERESIAWRTRIAAFTSTREALWWVLSITLVTRASYALGAWLVTRDASVFFEQDTGSYLAPARELLDRGTFTVGGQPELQRTPGYPLLLTAGLWLGALVPVTIAIQIALCVLTDLGVFVVTQRLTGNRRAAVLAAALYAFEPISIRQTATLGTETLFTASVVWALAAMIMYVRGASWRTLAVGTALLSIATYVRPAGYYLPFALLVFLAVMAAMRREWRHLPHVALATAIAVAAVLPWHLRNQALGFRGFSAIAAVNMYFYNAAAVQAVRTGTPYADVQAALGYRDGGIYLRHHPEQVTWRPGERFSYMREEGVRVVTEHLPLYARIHAAGMFRAMFDPGALSLLQPYHLYPAKSGVLSRIVSNGLVSGLREVLRTNAFAFSLLVVLGGILLALYILALRGLLVDRRFLDPSALLLALTVAYFITIAGGPIAVGRFRHPAMPFVCALAAAAWRWGRTVDA